MSRIERETDALRVAAEQDVQVAVALSRELEQELARRDAERGELAAQLEAAQHALAIARGELSNALLCAEEGAQEMIASEAQFEKSMAGAREEANRACAALQTQLEEARRELLEAKRPGTDEEATRSLCKQLEETEREMVAVLQSNATLASEVLRLEQQTQKADEIDELTRKNNALAAELLNSEKQRAALLNELESAVQMGQDVGVRVESDEAQRLRKELQDMKSVMEGLQTAAEGAVAECEKLAGVVEQRDAELAAVSQAKYPLPARMAAARRVADLICPGEVPRAFVGASLLDTEAVACAALDAITAAEAWDAPRAALKALFATTEARLSFVCNAAMWKEQSASCKFFVGAMTTVPQAVVQRLWARSKLYLTLGVSSKMPIAFQSQESVQRALKHDFGPSIVDATIAVLDSRYPMDVHTVAEGLAVVFKKRGLPEVNSMEEAAREVLVWRNESMSFEELRAQRFPVVVAAPEAPAEEPVDGMGQPLKGGEERLVGGGGDNELSFEERRASLFPTSKEKDARAAALEALSEPILNVKKLGAQVTALCLSHMLQSAEAGRVPPDTRKVLDDVASSYCDAVMGAVESVDAEGRAAFRGFVLRRLLTLLEKIRLSVVSQRRFSINLKTFTSPKYPALAEQDAQQSAAHLKQFCLAVARLAS